VTNWKLPTAQYNSLSTNFKKTDIEAIDYAARIIKEGGLVAFPTETVYGLGANALNPLAVAKIFKLKERPSFDPLIVHVASFDDLTKLTSNIDERVMQLALHFWPGPLTIVLPKSDIVPDLVTSGLPTVGIRMPDNKIALELIKRSGCPIAAPSANKFGQLSPTSAMHVKKQLPNVDYILDGGKTTVGIESTIVSVEDNICSILRPGRITLNEIKKALPDLFTYSTKKSEKIVAPGLLKSHYSPKKPLYLLKDFNIQIPHNSGVILHSQKKPISAHKVIYTSANHNLLEVASNLFSAMHAMEDDKEIEQIFIETVEEEGLGVAIMDRMKKAAYQYNA
jgi:L-threonylcarbamoyladenylate synthase